MQTLTRIFAAVVLLFAAVSTIKAQTNIDWEDAGVGHNYVLNQFENGPYPQDNANLSRTDNPNPSGINTTAKCIKMKVLDAGQNWAGFWFVTNASNDNSTPFTITADNCIIKMMVYKPIASTVAFKIQDFSENTKYAVKYVPNTKINEWEEITFDFTSEIGKTFHKIVIMPDSRDRSSDVVCYIDEISFNGKNPLYESVYADYDNIDLTFGGFAGATFSETDNPLSSGINTSARVASSTKPSSGNGGQDYTGIYTSSPLDPLVISTYSKFTLKVYSPQSGIKINLKLENADGSQVRDNVVINTKVNEWEELSFNLSGATSGLYTKIVIFFDMEKTRDVDYTYYFDDLRLINRSDDNITTFNLSGSGFSDAVLANTSFTVYSGTYTVDASKTIKSMTVEGKAKLTIEPSDTLTVTDIKLKSDILGYLGTFIDKGSLSVSGQSSVEQYLPSARNWYISSPVSGATVPSGQNYYIYDEASSAWVVVSGGTAMTPSKGYIAQPGVATPITYIGAFNSGPQSIGLTRTALADKPGFNLVANPYPSYLDWSKVDTTTAKVLSTMWYRTKTSGGAYTYDTYNGSLNVATTNGVNKATKLIPPMQAFWVRLKEGETSGTLSFENTMRSHIDEERNMLKVKSIDETKLIRLRITNQSYSDEALVCVHPNASYHYESYDSPKFFNNKSNQPEIYTTVDAEKLVINGLNEIVDNEQLAIGYSYGTEGDLSIELVELINFYSNVKVYLLDKQLSTVTELTTDTKYTFNTSASTLNENRFSLLFKVQGTTTNVYTNSDILPNSVFVDGLNKINIVAKEKADYFIFNALGQLVDNGKLNVNHKILNLNLVSGFYFVNVDNKTTKIFIK